MSLRQIAKGCPGVMSPLCGGCNPPVWAIQAPGYSDKQGVPGTTTPIMQVQ